MESPLYRHEDSEIDLEIKTLLHRRKHHADLEDPIHGVLRKLTALSLADTDSPHAHLKEFYDFPIGKEESHQQVHREKPARDLVVVNGGDIGDFPTEYAVKGLKRHEVPVIGTFVHKSVVPGFSYLVRKLGTEEQYQFKKQPLTLQRIGQGYGKRLTFESFEKNSNDNYFYSDTRPQGYGFSIVALSKGDPFNVLDDSDDGPVGEGVITDVGEQREVASHTEEDGTIVKTIDVQFCCDVKYGSDKHGLLPLFHEYTLLLHAIAVVVKKKNQRRAVTQGVEQLELPLLGPCRLQLNP